MRALPALALALTLAACATPQQRCINQVTQDLRVVTDLIAETEGNLRRGYALEETVVYRPYLDYCDDSFITTTGPDGERRIVSVPRMCWEDDEEIILRPRAIDLDAERRKLDGQQRHGLIRQQRTQNERAAPQVEQCRALYPE